eukprot:3612828-Rhodomonas_salina.3
MAISDLGKALEKDPKSIDFFFNRSQASPASALRTRYAMSGTDIPYGATRGCLLYTSDAADECSV